MSAINNSITPYLTNSNINKQINSKENQEVNKTIDFIKDKAFSSISASLIPVNLIKYAARAKQILVKATIEALIDRPTTISDKELATSCHYNTYAVGVIFLGIETVKEIAMNINQEMDFNAQLTPLKKTYKYKISRLLDGPMIHFIQKNLESAPLKKEMAQEQDKYEEKLLNTFSNYTKSVLAEAKKDIISSEQTDDKIIEKIREIFTTLRFTFNDETILSLQKEIKKNSEKTHPKRSFIYFVSVLCCAYTTDHQFVIEQYTDEQQCVRYRLYQAWINQATLLDDLCKRKYGEKDEGSWNQQELDHFLMQLKDLYGVRPGITYQDCFGYSRTIEPVLTFSNDTFEATSLRFLSFEANPLDCFTNLGKLMELDPNFKIEMNKIFELT